MSTRSACLAWHDPAAYAEVVAVATAARRAGHDAQAASSRYLEATQRDLTNPSTLEDVQVAAAASDVCVKQAEAALNCIRELKALVASMDAGQAEPTG